MNRDNCPEIDHEVWKACGEGDCACDWKKRTTIPPVPVSYPSQQWCDSYAEWFEHERPAIAEVHRLLDVIAQLKREKTELLEALGSLLDAPTDLSVIGINTRRDAFNKARAAIAKATGEEA